MTATTEGVTIQYDGSPVTLRYTLGAAKRVNAFFGDFVAAYRRVSALDFTAQCVVVAAAFGKEVAEVEEAVFRSGVAAIAGDLSLYLAWLGNGGRDPVVKEDEKGGGSGNA